MFKRLVLEKRHSRLGKEEQKLANHAAVLGIPVVHTYEKTVSRGHFIFEPTDLVAGSVGFMHHAMRNFGIHVHHNHPYPEALKDKMFRKVLPVYNRRDLEQWMFSHGAAFVKPVETKIFTGFVCHDINDPRFNGIGRQKELICTEVVEFMHEWRIYVCNGERLRVEPATDFHGAVWFPHRRIVSEFIDRINASFVEIPAGYAIDVGTLYGPIHDIALVEVNDAYSLGAYGFISDAEYWKLIAARWAQLLEVKQNG